MKQQRFDSAVKIASAWVAKLASLVALLLGAVVLAGWFSRNSLVLQIKPEYVAMQPNTAFCFLFCGLGLWLYFFKRTLLARVCGAVVILVTALTLVEYLFFVNLGIDQWITTYVIPVGTAYPGRMAPGTAICLFLVGFGILYLSLGWDTMVVGPISAAVFTVSLVAFIGYLGGIEPAYGWGGVSEMALHTSLGCMILAIGLAGDTLRHYGVERTFNILNLPMWIFLAGAAISVALAQNIRLEERANVTAAVEANAKNVSALLERSINHKVSEIQRMAERWRVRGGIPRGEWEQDARFYVRGETGIQAIEWADPSLRVKWVVPYEGNETAANLNIAFDPSRRKAADAAIQDDRLVISDVVDLVQGGKGVIAYYPLFVGKKKKFDGLMVIVLSVHDLVMSATNKHRTRGYHYRVIQNERVVFEDSPVAPDLDKKWGQQVPVNFFNQSWNLRVWPGMMRLSKTQTALPAITLVVGLSLSFFMGLASFLAQKTSFKRREIAELVDKRTRALQVANQRLKEKITEVDQAKNSLRTLSKKLTSAQEDERKRLARELHDEFGQKLTGIVFDLGQMRAQLDDKDMKKRTDAVFLSVKSLIDEVRRFSRQIHPTILDDLGLEAAIHWLVGEFRNRSQIHCDFVMSCEESDLSETQQIAFFRFAQEGLTNVLKHSFATKVDLLLEEQKGFFSLSICDNGAGIPQNFVPGLGLVGMQERAISLGGDLIIKQRKSGGTDLLFKIPKSEPVDQDDNKAFAPGLRKEESAADGSKKGTDGSSLSDEFMS